MEIQLAKALGRAAAFAVTQLGNIQLMDWRRGALVIKTSLGFDAHFLETFRQVPLTAPTICARAALERKPVLVPDVFADDAFAPYHDIAREAGFHGVLSTPMISRSKIFVGVLSLHFAKGETPDNPAVALDIARATADELLA
jgi:GAF domain-containing protein